MNWHIARKTRKRRWERNQRFFFVSAKRQRRKRTLCAVHSSDASLISFFFIRFVRTGSSVHLFAPLSHKSQFQLPSHDNIIYFYSAISSIMLRFFVPNSAIKHFICHTRLLSITTFNCIDFSIGN